MTLYSDEVKHMLAAYQFPESLVVDVVEYPTHLSLRLYRDNFETFDGVDKQFIAKQIGAAIEAVRKRGCPCYMEVVKGDGKNVRGT